MKLVRHYLAGLVFFAALAVLVTQMYGAVQTEYSINDTYEGDWDNGTITEAMEDMDIIEGLQSFSDGIYKIVNPSGIEDIIGGLMSTAFGTLQLVYGFVVMPIQIFTIISHYYHIPTIIPILICTLVLLYIGFIILSARLRGEV